MDDPVQHHLIIVELAAGPHQSGEAPRRAVGEEQLAAVGGAVTAAGGFIKRWAKGIANFANPAPQTPTPPAPLRDYMAEEVAKMRQTAAASAKRTAELMGVIS
jgi:hypothetical protein